MKRIYLTIDTECHDIKKRNLYIDGNLPKGNCGLDFMLKLGKSLGIPLNFFVDVAEAREYEIAFVQEIVKTIKLYGQNVYLHLHPDFITGDKSKTFLWEYSYDEKKHILEEGLAIYKDLLGEDAQFFRVGRYGADSEMYQALRDLGVKLTDLSYCYRCPKMCHLYYDDIKIKNKRKTYYNQLILPNTRYKGFYFGKFEHFINLDANDTTFDEFKRFISKTDSECIVMTMHSWNFIKKYFFSNKISLNRQAVRKFKKMVQYAQESDFEFCDLRDNPPEAKDEKDEIIDLCNSPIGTIKMYINTFIRFQSIARLNKKYFIFYTFFYSFIVAMIVLLLFVI